ncbi:DUF2333 family protein [Halomonas sp. GXIMD04776]|uniref:DUF2333 family protein n=1 Tax=Halomonas sp. GXIMD04776 TaxID=3415605 RepID=UPI003CB90D63
MAIFRKRKHRTDVLERPEYGWIWKPLLTLLVLYLVVCLGLGIWWSQRPDNFDVTHAVLEQRQHPTAPAPRGTVMTATLATTIETLLDKPGGYLRNDKLLPGVWLDNMPSWEYGVLTQARLLTQTLPAFGAGDTSLLSDASDALDSDSRDWLYPGAEKHYRRALTTLHGYLSSFTNQGMTGFADNGGPLAQWLRKTGQRLDGITERLSASIDDPEALRKLGVNESALPEDTPWLRIDDTFFTARGETWALLHYLQAVKHDYADIVAKADGNETLDRVIAELKLAQRRLWSPMVLNGKGFGMFANHSLLLANYTQTAARLTDALAQSVENVEVKPAKGQDEPSADTQPVDQSPANTASSPASSEEKSAPSDKGAGDGDKADETVSGDTQSDKIPQETAKDPVSRSPSADVPSTEDIAAPGPGDDEDITPSEPAEAAPESPVAPPMSEEEPQ